MWDTYGLFVTVLVSTYFWLLSIFPLINLRQTIILHELNSSCAPLISMLFHAFKVKDWVVFNPHRLMSSSWCTLCALRKHSEPSCAGHSAPPAVSPLSRRVALNIQSWWLTWSHGGCFSQTKNHTSSVYQWPGSKWILIMSRSKAQPDLLYWLCEQTLFWIELICLI